jgi:hypothetical protein
VGPGEQVRHGPLADHPIGPGQTPLESEPVDRQPPQQRVGLPRPAHGAQAQQGVSAAGAEVGSVPMVLGGAGQ